MRTANGQKRFRDLAILLSLFVVVASIAAPIMNIGAQPKETSKPSIISESSDNLFGAGILVILGLATCVGIAVLSLNRGTMRAR